MRGWVLAGRLASRGNVCCWCPFCGYVALEQVPSWVCCTQQLFLAAFWVSNLLSRMISQNKCFPLHLNLRRAFPWEPARGRCSSAQAWSFPPPVTTCLLPQHSDPPLGPAASSVPGPAAPPVRAQVLCEQWPCGFPVIAQLPSAGALPGTDYPHMSAVSLTPDFTTSPPLRRPPASTRSSGEAWTRPICPRTAASGVSAARLLGLRPLSSPRTDTLLCRSGNEVQRASPAYRWKCPTKLQINLNFAKLSIKNMPTSLLSRRQRLSRSRLSGENNKREQHNCSRKRTAIGTEMCEGL